MSVIKFETTPFKINSWTIIKLPENASAKLPSRGMVLVEGTINGYKFKTPLEPDGKGSHWLKVDKFIQKGANITAGNIAELTIEPSREWPEPEVPVDINKALAADSKAHDIWLDVTPMARWDWIRWINSTGKQETRKHRIEVALSKLKNGTRRPCCFNRALCTVPEVSKSGVLLEPTAATK